MKKKSTVFDFSDVLLLPFQKRFFNFNPLVIVSAGSPSFINIVVDRLVKYTSFATVDQVANNFKPVMETSEKSFELIDQFKLKMASCDSVSIFRSKQPPSTFNFDFEY